MLVMPNEIAALPRDRLIALDGGRNFRDLGGYPTSDGRHVRWGLMFRSGSLAGLTAGDWDALTKRGIRAICDLRTQKERATEPFVWADQPGLSYWARDYELSFAVLSETLRGDFPTGDTARAGMIAGYADLPFEQAPSYRQLFKHLAAGNLPVVFNCAAGKDRAGTAAALILTALGVPRDLVIEDYTMTNRVYDVEATLRRPRQGYLARFDADVGAVIARADPAYIEAALDAVDQRCGGIDGYLAEQLDIDSSSLEALRELLLE
jgi:protein-tyrosine phosphatase